MCTLVILRRPGHRWPVLIGANRDEMIDRASKPPGRHWPDRPELVAGLDILAGGSWLGVNDWGVAAAVLNRHGSLGPAPDRRSRGELVLEALDHADAAAAARALVDLDPEAYAQRVVEAQLQPGGTKNVVDKLTADLGAKDPTFTAARIRFELEHFAEEAKRQLMNE